jgi:hypothetical protein
MLSEWHCKHLPTTKSRAGLAGAVATFGALSCAHAKLDAAMHAKVSNSFPENPERWLEKEVREVISILSDVDQLALMPAA